jgi:hypothetical protein
MTKQATEMSGTLRGLVKSERPPENRGAGVRVLAGESFPGWITGNGLAPGRPGSSAQAGRSIEKANNSWTVSVAAESSIPQDLTRRQS